MRRILKTYNFNTSCNKTKKDNKKEENNVDITEDKKIII
jgi:hypothetical protein